MPSARMPQMAPLPEPLPDLAPLPETLFRSSRYSDQPMGWRTRCAGAGGTVGLFAVLALAMLIAWRVVQPLVAAPAPMVTVALDQLAAPPEPVREVPEGPPQVEQREQPPQEQAPADPPPEIQLQQIPLHAQPVTPPAAPAPQADPVPETTAPRSLPAPTASRVAADVEMTWQAQVMAHLEKHRRYPAAARARGQQGVAYVTFRMDRTGRVLTSRVSRTSGAPVLDRAAIDTLNRAQPLPAIPADMPDELELTVQVEFFTR